MHDPKLKKGLLKRIHTVQGQLHGIEQMLEEGRDAQDIFTQMKAVERGVHTAVHDVLEDHLKRQLAERLSARLATCSGSCDDAERLQLIRREFARLEFKDIISSLEWLMPPENNSPVS